MKYRHSILHPSTPGLKFRSLALAGLLLWVWFAPLCAAPSALPGSTAAPAQQTPAEPSTKEVKALIETLENEQSRTRLIEQLRLLIKAQEQEQPDGGDATAKALRDLSKSTVDFINQFVLVAGGVDELPKVADWLRSQALDAKQRKIWTRTLLNLALILSAGYAALVLLRLGLRRPRRLITEKTRERWWVRLGMLFLTGLIDLIPIGGFAVAGYLSLGLVNPAEPTRLVAMAWINAILLVHVLHLAGRLVFCAGTPNLRLWRLDDESAHYAEIWVRRLSGVGVYGYFLIQSVYFFGLPQYAFSALLR